MSHRVFLIADLVVCVQFLRDLVCRFNAVFQTRLGLLYDVLWPSV